MAGDHEHRQIFVALAKKQGQRHAGDAGHLVVRDQQIERAGIGHGQGGDCAAGLHNRPAFVSKNGRDESAHEGLVVYDKGDGGAASVCL